jgi:negative regulator of flagellin synthesis FlgM
MDMKINGVTPSKVMNLYSNNTKNVQKKTEVSKKDSVQISSLGKKLSSYSLEGETVNSKEKIEELRNQVSKGTYNRDSKLVAGKIIDETKRQ